MRKSELDERQLNALDWSAETMFAEFLPGGELEKFCTLSYREELRYEGGKEGFEVDSLHPFLMGAKAALNKEDYPKWWDAMKSPNADDWWAAAQKEIETLEKIKAWDVVDRDDELMNILKSTWALRLKRYPDGAARKFKGRFCVRGDMQIKGVGFHETWAPVVSWTTVHMMLILECLLELQSMQADINCAFLHAELDETERIFVEMPEGFKQQGKVLQLRRNLYGLKQAPRNFYKYTVTQMDEVGLVQSNHDPCLFIGLQ